MSSSILPSTDQLTLTRTFNIEKIKQATELARQLHSDRVLLLLKYHYSPVFYVEQWFCTYYGSTYQTIYYDKCALCNERFCKCMSNQCVYATEYREQQQD